jgi:hypothetical protein
MLVSALISAFPCMVGLTSKEQSLLKLFIFPLVFRCLFSKAFELRLLPTFRHGDIVAYVMGTGFFGAITIAESYSN